MAELELPDIASASALEKADAVIAEQLVPHSEHALVRLVRAVGDLSDQEPLYAASAAVIATGLVFRDDRIVRGGTRILAAHLLATALRGVIKHLVDRTRPVVAARKGRYELTHGQRFESDFNSFPSGHTAGAVAVARSVARVWPDAAPLAFGLAGTAGAAQVICSKHFVSDVAAGALVGLLAETAINGLISRAQTV